MSDTKPTVSAPEPIWKPTQYDKVDELVAMADPPNGKQVGGTVVRINEKLEHKYIVDWPKLGECIHKDGELTWHAQYNPKVGDIVDEATGTLRGGKVVDTDKHRGPYTEELPQVISVEWPGMDEHVGYHSGELKLAVKTE